MTWLRRRAAFLCAALALAAVLTPGGAASPPTAQANVACDVGGAVAAPLTGALGIGSPVGDACNAVTDPVLGLSAKALDPLKNAAKSLGSGIFNQITTWAADGAVWLIGRVAALTTKTTSPDLLSKGFLREYRQMVRIAAVLAVLMLILACVEGLGRGDGAMLWRVLLVNVPVAALATSSAYVLVQLLVSATDGFSEVIAHSTASDMRDFFKSAIEGLVVAGAGVGTAAGGPGAGTTAGAVAVPVFVGFIAAVVAALAAFLVWIELLMRDAAIYAVALFMPLAIAASIWPRWIGALRRTGELVVVVVFSKFVIVAIIALAASLLSNTGGKIEHVLAAGALMLLACFAPFVLFRLVPFAEGAVSSAFHRQSAGGASMRTVELASSMQMMRRSALANWAASGTKAKGDSGTGGDSSGGRGDPKPSPRGGGTGSGGGAAGGEAAGASGGAAGAVALPAAAGVSAAKGSRAAAGRLAGSGTSRASAAAGSGGAGGGSEAGATGEGSQEAAPRPSAREGKQDSEATGSAASRPSASGEAPSSPPAGSTPQPREASGGGAGSGETKPPRPGGEVGTAGKGGASVEKGKA